jgi:hypothetical protein
MSTVRPLTTQDGNGQRPAAYPLALPTAMKKKETDHASAAGHMQTKAFLPPAW